VKSILNKSQEAIPEMQVSQVDELYDIILTQSNQDLPAPSPG